MNWTKLAAGIAVAMSLAAQGARGDEDDHVPLADAPSSVKPGTIALLKAGKGMQYFLRVPDDYDPAKGARLVVFLHGSNMSGIEYLRTIYKQDWCDDAILACPNGEKPGRTGGGKGEETTDAKPLDPADQPYGPNNFTFESAPLVADVTQALQKAFKTTLTYVGGHSQGGFLTYSVILEFPDLYQGAFPMSGDCWMQNEPNLWEDRPLVLAKQRRVAVAVIHGHADKTVEFAQGEHGYDVLRDEGWTRLRLFAPERIGHQFMLLPVDEALDWLDAINGRDEAKSLELARGWAKDGEWGWVREAANACGPAKPDWAKLLAMAEDSARTATPTLSEWMAKGDPVNWVPRWLEHWRVHGGATAAKPLVERYLKQRDGQRAKGHVLFAEAKAAFAADRDADGYAKLDQLLKEAPCSYQGYYAWKWLATRPEREKAKEEAKKKKDKDGEK